MKNIILALILFVGFSSTLSFAGDCANGTCFAPVRKVVNVTKNIVVAPVRAAVVLATPNTCTKTVVTDCCGATVSRSREVCKYQPLRRRLLHRTTTVGCGCQ